MKKKIIFRSFFFKKISKVCLKKIFLKNIMGFFVHFLKIFRKNKRFNSEIPSNFSSVFGNIEFSNLFLGKKILFMSLTFLPNLIFFKGSMIKKKKRKNFSNQGITKKVKNFWALFFSLLNNENRKNLKKFYLLILNKLISLEFQKDKFSICSWKNWLRFLISLKSFGAFFHWLIFFKNNFVMLKTKNKEELVIRLLKIRRVLMKKKLSLLLFRFLMELLLDFPIQTIVKIIEEVFRFLEILKNRNFISQKKLENIKIFQILKILIFFLIKNFQKDWVFFYNLKIFSIFKNFILFQETCGISIINLISFLELRGNIVNHKSKAMKDLFCLFLIEIFTKKKVRNLEISKDYKQKAFNPVKICFLKKSNFLGENVIENIILLINFKKAFFFEFFYLFEMKIFVKYLNFKKYLFFHKLFRKCWN